MELSKAQREAMETIYGQVILISCPGSGKTSTVVRRVAYMIEQGIPPEQLLVLTFSKAAADEMRSRFKGLSKEAPHIEFCTIHAFCYRVLCAAYHLSRENILTENEGWMIVRRGLDELRRNKELSMDIRDYADFTSSCMLEISVINNNGVDWESYRAKTCPTRDFKKIYDLYENTKFSMGKIDFDDMLKLCFSLFNERKDILDQYKNLFRYIIVDEYQDTSYLQRDILYLLAGGKDEANICVVGDDDQSIYKFRGARPEIMLDFPKQYPDCKQIHMSINYRSEPEIIEAAKKLIAHNRKRFPKDITPNRSGKGTIEKIEAKDSTDETIRIIGKIKDLSGKYKLEDMAILYRNNRQAAYLSIMLMANKIPFHSNDPVISPYEHWIFQDVLSFYRLAEGIGTVNDLVNVINKPMRFVPVTALRKLGCVDSDEVTQAVYSAVKDPWKQSKTVAQVKKFFRDLKLLKGVAPLDFIDILDKFLGYEAYLRNYAQYRNQDPKELTDILEMYKTDIQNYKITTMADLKAHADMINEKIRSINRNRTKKGVEISTMHRAKGLEWDAVILYGCNEDIIPSPRMEDSDDLEEERRLFYVAVTRAKEYLCIAYPKNTFSKEPSRFIGELFSDKNEPRKIPVRFRKGDKVYHKGYGEGTVIQTTNEIVLVKFLAKTVLVKFEGDEISKLIRR